MFKKKKKNNTKAEMQDAILSATHALKFRIINTTDAEADEHLAKSVEHLAQAFEHVSNSK